MKKKYLPGLAVALIALIVAGFVTANNVNRDSNPKTVQGTSNKNTSNNQSASKTEASKPAEAGASPTAPSSAPAGQPDTGYNTENLGGQAGGVPADQRRSVWAIVTKPVQNNSQPNQQADTANQGNQGGQGSGGTPVTPAAAPESVPSPAPTPAPNPAPAPAPTPPLSAVNLVVNPGAEESTNGVPTGWTQGSYGVNDAKFTYATSGYNGSAHSLQVDMTTRTDGDAKWISADIPVTSGTTYQVGDFYKSTGASQVNIRYFVNGVETYAWIGDAAPVADWAAFNSQFTVPAGVTAIAVAHILTSVGNLTTDNYSVTAGAVTAPTPTPTPTPTPPSGVVGGRVSLTFDDGLASMYTNGLPLLEKYGFNSTQYWISSTFTGGDPNYMTEVQAKDLLARQPGTEVAGHTVHHCDLTGQQTDDPTNCPLGLSAEQQAALNNTELSQGKADLQNMFGVTVSDFATPYGAYNDQVIAQIKAAGYVSHRSTDDGYNTIGAVNTDNILVQNITSSTTPATVKSWVDQAIASNTWLVLVYHGVDTSGDLYSVTPGNLDQELADIKASGVKVVTVSQALAGI